MDQSNQTPKAPESREQKNNVGSNASERGAVNSKYGECSAAIRLSHGASFCGLQWKPGRHYPHKSE